MDLQKLTNQELEKSFHHVVKTERKIMHSVILHIQEISRRKLYLEKPYGSLYDYLTKEMLYSGPSAQRRIEGARLADDVPSVVEKLESGEINLSQICELQKAVKDAEKIHQVQISAETKAELLDHLSGLNISKSQQLIAESLDIPVSQSESIKTQKDNSRKVELTFTDNQWAKFEKLRGLFAHKNFQKKRTQKMNDVLETLFDQLLSDHGFDGELQADIEIDNLSLADKGLEVESLSRSGIVDGMHSTQKSGMQSKQRSSSGGMTTGNTAPEKLSPTSKPWNSLTPKRKKIILRQDQSCQYTNYETGRICGSTFNLPYYSPQIFG